MSLSKSPTTAGTIVISTDLSMQENSSDMESSCVAEQQVDLDLLRRGRKGFHRLIGRWRPAEEGEESLENLSFQHIKLAGPKGSLLPFLWLHFFVVAFLSFQQWSTDFPSVDAGGRSLMETLGEPVWNRLYILGGFIGNRLWIQYGPLLLLR